MREFHTSAKRVIVKAGVTFLSFRDNRKKFFRFHHLVQEVIMQHSSPVTSAEAHGSLSPKDAVSKQGIGITSNPIFRLIKNTTMV